MLKKQRNAFIQMIQDARIDPRIFSVTSEKEEGNHVFRLSVGSTPLLFAVRSMIRDEKRHFAYKASTCTIVEPPIFHPGLNWSSWFEFPTIEERFKTWLEGSVKKYLAYSAEVVEDQTTPDLWAELSSTTSAESEIINTPFTSAEQTKIEESLTEFETEIHTREILTEEQAKLLHERIEYLVESSKRLGRKDWLAVAAGALVGCTLQAGLTPEVATQVLHLAGEALRWIAQTPLLLPG